MGGFERDAKQEGDRQLTFGEKLVGLTFNPSGDPTVTQLKHMFATIIDAIDKMPTTNELHDHLKEAAVIAAVDAQMWAVKAATWKK